MLGLKSCGDEKPLGTVFSPQRKVQSKHGITMAATQILKGLTVKCDDQNDAIPGSGDTSPSPNEFGTMLLQIFCWKEAPQRHVHLGNAKNSNEVSPVPSPRFKALLEDISVREHWCLSHSATSMHSVSGRKIYVNAVSSTIGKRHDGETVIALKSGLLRTA